MSTLGRLGSNLAFHASRKFSFLFEKPWWQHLGKTLRYSLYVVVHPIDGFWDLIHEKRGSIAAAHIFVAAAILVEVMRLTLTSFQFVTINMEFFNAAIVFMRILLPLLMWTVANWALTTLLDGKGRMPHVYMAIAYSLVPYVILNAVMIALSQFITYEEGAIYWVLNGFAYFWTGVLLFSGMMMIHDYTPWKTVWSSFLTVIGMMVMLFIFVVFFSLISDAVAYFASVYREILFRLL